MFQRQVRVMVTERHMLAISRIVKNSHSKHKTLAEDARFTTNTLNFLYLLVDKKRMLLIKDITKEFETIFNESTDMQLTTVTLAMKIEQSELSLVAKKIQCMSQARNVRIKNVVDPQLAIVTSAVKIEQSQLSLIAKKIQSMSQAKNVRIKNVVDPSLIVGKDGSRFIDMSVKGQLNKLASQFAIAENTRVF
jgi:F-type H+-transporting ATPase subunit delta